MANQESSLVDASATSLNIIPTLKDKESIILKTTLDSKRSLYFELK